MLFSPQPQNYTNNRNHAWQYDLQRNLTDDGSVQYSVDAAGRTHLIVMPDMEQTQVFDGGGQRVKMVEALPEIGDDGMPTGQTSTTMVYEIRSTVLGGGVVTEVDGATGQKLRTLLYLNGAVMGWQERAYNGAQSVKWEHRDAHNASYRMSAQSGFLLTDYSAELDPMNTNAGLTTPPSMNPTPYEVRRMFESSYPSFGGLGSNEALIDGFWRPIGEAMHLANYRLGNPPGNWDTSYTPASTEWVDAWEDCSKQSKDPDGPINININTCHRNVGYFKTKGSVGGQVSQQVPQNPHNERKLTTAETGGIRDILQKYLEGNRRCANFMSAFLTELGRVTGVAPFSNDPLKIFNRLAEQDRLYSTDRPDGRAFAGGSVGTGNAVLLFNFTKMLRSPQSFVSVILHEISHTAPGGGRVEYSHDQMDRAAFNVLEPEILSHTDLFGNTIMGIGRPEFMPGVSYFGKYIDKYCSL